MKVKPWAEFTSDLPEDAIEDEGGFIQWPGKSVTEAVAQMLASLGCQVSEPIHAHERGWELDVSIGKRRLWVQITLIDKYLLVLEQNSWLAKTFGQLWPEYLDILKRFSSELGKDSRFHDVEWFAPKAVHTGAKGAKSPV